MVHILCANQNGMLYLKGFGLPDVKHGKLWESAGGW